MNSQMKMLNNHNKKSDATPVLPLESQYTNLVNLRKEKNSKVADDWLQEAFLTSLRIDRSVVSIYLVSGIRLKGIVEAHDRKSVLLIGPSVQLILKSSISTIQPDQT
jgi:RNA chaperone Hfq